MVGASRFPTACTMNSLLGRRCLATIAIPRPKRQPLPKKPKGPVVIPPAPRIPPTRPEDGIKTPSDFLRIIGRNAHEKLKVPDDLSWTSFFEYERRDLKAVDVPVRDRRYILWAMQQYRMGKKIEDFVHEVPKKKFRGHGPSVQKGKLLRSKRHKLPKKAQLKMTMHGPITPPNKIAKIIRLSREAEQRKLANNVR